MSKQPQAAAQLKGTPLWRMSKKFNFAAEKIIPDSFVFCIILTFLVFVLSLLLCGKSPLELLVGWWDGLSSQFTLAFQMGIMVVVCATCARSPQVNRLLNKMSSMVHSRTTALVLMMIFGYVTSMMNYAFCHSSSHPRHAACQACTRPALPHDGGWWIYLHDSGSVPGAFHHPVFQSGY